MPATLQIIPASAEPFELKIGNIATIGRLPDSTVCFSDRQSVSRQHAIIRSQNGQHYQVIDLGGLNGTFVNGQQVVLPVTLEDGARIQIANNEIIFVQPEELSDEYNKATTLWSGLPGQISTSSFVALMICDVRGFTTASETFSKGHVAKTLGGWFREAGNLIHQSGGSIDKFLGDAFFAYWPASETKASACEAAFNASRELLQLARAMRWPDEKRAFEIVVALHCGDVICRNVGLIAERDTTMMGDAVNTVFRLEPVAKELNQLLLASEDFLGSLQSNDGFRDLGERLLKGKAQPVRIFGFDGDEYAPE